MSYLGSVAASPPPVAVAPIVAVVPPPEPPPPQFVKNSEIKRTKIHLISACELYMKILLSDTKQIEEERKERVT